MIMMGGSTHLMICSTLRARDSLCAGLFRGTYALGDA